MQRLCSKLSQKEQLRATFESQKPQFQYKNYHIYYRKERGTEKNIEIPNDELNFNTIFDVSRQEACNCRLWKQKVKHV